jgi:hypothetical protein
MANCDLTNSYAISGSCSGSQGDFGGLYFAGGLDKQLIKNITNELIKKIANQVVYIYQIDNQRTKSNIYGEAENKIFKDSVKMWTRIEFNEPMQTFDNFSFDTKYNVNMYFYKAMTDEADLKINQGDIIRIGGIDNNKTIWLEVSKMYMMQPQLGQTDNLICEKVICTTARQSLVSRLSRMEQNNKNI